MKITKSVFVKSVATKEDILLGDYSEIALVGRSNAGKSSFINAVCKNKISKTSSVPGKTRLINYFLINDSFMFVDLPGYGFNKAGKTNTNLWSNLIEHYLLKSTNLKLVLVLVDIRHIPSKLDELMLKFLYIHNIPFKVIAAKCDKIAKSKINIQIQTIANVLKLEKGNIIPFSIIDPKYNEKIYELINS